MKGIFLVLSQKNYLPRKNRVQQEGTHPPNPGNSRRWMEENKHPLEFPAKGGGGSKVKVPSVGGWIIFCNYTFQNFPTTYRHGYGLFGYPLLSCNELRNPNWLESLYAWRHFSCHMKYLLNIRHKNDVVLLKPSWNRSRRPIIVLIV